MGRISLLSLSFLLIILVLFNNDDSEKNTRIASGNENTVIAEKESYVDFLYLKLATDRQAKVAVLGSSVTAGSGASNYKYSWPARLEQKLEKTHPNFKKMKLFNHGKRRFSTSDLLAQGIVEEVVLIQPDLIIFETAIINNHGHSIPMDQTLNDIKTIVEILEMKLPHAKIILTSPNPISARDHGKALNGMGLSYQDYLIKTQQFIRLNGWSYVDVYSGMEAMRKKEVLPLEQILKDGIHPNNKGYEYWSKIISDFLYKKQERI